MKKETTEKLIFALKILTEKKSLDEISVTELTHKAKINRGTFYLTYDDFNDFILAIEKELLTGFKKTLIYDFVACGLGTGMANIFKYIYDNMLIFKIAMLAELFLKQFEKAITAFIAKYNCFNPSIPNEYSQTLLLNSTVAIIKIWIFEKEPRSVEEITNIFYKTRTLSPINLDTTSDNNAYI